MNDGITVYCSGCKLSLGACGGLEYLQIGSEPLFMSANNETSPQGRMKQWIQGHELEDH